MPLVLHNVRTRRKEPFVPRTPGRVGLYVCGLTVYDHVHIGHARTYVAFEVIRRVLERRVGPVHHVMNVTDVDDKILARAKERGVSPRQHAAEWDATCRRELEGLGIRLPSGNDYPHVTTSIPDILRFVARIVRNGFAYVTPEGNVYFDVPGYDRHAALHLKDAEGRPCGYGSLSNRDYRQMAAGTRKDVEGDKRHPADFAVWKAAEPGDHPDANWDPAREAPDAARDLPGIRPGRPGWHIECSLMSTRALGDTFDVHGGGQDLIFPHHENEVAQSQAGTGQAPFVDVWVHTGFLNVEGEKMSKSLGNFITLPQALEELRAQGLGPEALRLYFLQTHYRSKIDFSRDGLAEAGAALRRLRATRGWLEAIAGRSQVGCAEQDVPLQEAAARLREQAFAALDDDVHTPGALAALFEFQRTANRLVDAQTPERPIGSGAAAAALAALAEVADTLNLFDAGASDGASAGVPEALRDAARRLGIGAGDGGSQDAGNLGGGSPYGGRGGGMQDGTAPDEASILAAFLAARDQARARKDWARSDAIRAEARAAGYLIEDTPGGQRWRKA